MVGRPDEAEDVTQDVLVKVITGLANFRGESAFRTWLYRITANHVLSMRHGPREYPSRSFREHAELVDGRADAEPTTSGGVTAEARFLDEETRTRCMTGMLLCLDRAQRLAFVLGAMFGASSVRGGEILAVTPEAFRQTLSRARKQLSNFMDEKCGLMRRENPCRCPKKTRCAIQTGHVDPHQLRFRPAHLQRIRDVAPRCRQGITSLLEARTDDLFREHPFLRAPDCVKLLDSLFACATH